MPSLEAVQKELQAIHTPEAFLIYLSTLPEGDKEKPELRAVITRRWQAILAHPNTPNEPEAIDIKLIKRELESFRQQVENHEYGSIKLIKCFLHALVIWKKSPRWLTDKKQIAALMLSVFNLLVTIASEKDVSDISESKEEVSHSQFVLPFSLYDLIGGYEERFALYLCRGTALQGDDHWPEGSYQFGFVDAAFHLFQWKTCMDGALTGFIPFTQASKYCHLRNEIFSLCEARSEEVATIIHDAETTPNLLVYLASPPNNGYWFYKLFKTLNNSTLENKFIDAILQANHAQVFLQWGAHWVFSNFFNIVPTAIKQDKVKVQEYFKELVLVGTTQNQVLTESNVKGDYRTLCQHIAAGYLTEKNLSKDLLKHAEATQALVFQEIQRKKQKYVAIRNAIQKLDTKAFEAYENTYPCATLEEKYTIFPCPQRGAFSYQDRSKITKELTPWVLDERLKDSYEDDAEAKKMFTLLFQKDEQLFEAANVYFNGITCSLGMGSTPQEYYDNAKKFSKKHQDFLEKTRKISDKIVSAIEVFENYFDPKPDSRPITRDSLKRALHEVQSQYTYATRLGDFFKEIFENILTLIPALRRMLKLSGINPTHRSTASLLFGLFKQLPKQENTGYTQFRPCTQ